MGVTMNKKVAVLMSTYNGERYLEEQIQSIINQSYKNWILYIRDDGSKDSTVNIIEKYTDHYDNIVFFNKNRVKNVGVVKSFMELLANVKADYYMFSDQDDVWLENKIKNSVDKLSKNEPGPVCVFTDVEIVNQDLAPVRRMNGSKVCTDFISLLFTNYVTGCAMLFNDELKSLIKFNQINYQNIFMHDWWIGLLASAFGKLVYLDEATMLYRQHSDNVVGSNKKNTLPRIIYRLTHLDQERANVKRVVNIAYEFSREYPSSLEGKQQLYIDKYAALTDKSSISNNLKLVMKLVPQRLNPKGKVFFSYLLVVFHNDFLK